MTFFLGLVFKFFSSGILTKVADYLEKRSADQALMHGQDMSAATAIVVAQINAEIEARKAQVEFSSRHDKLVAWIVAPFILHVWMLVLDRCFHLGWDIGMLPDPLNDWEGRILLSFFIVTPAANLAKVALSIMRK
ncbi:hypothetical protein HL667_06295 [Bradyrhizobium sp. 83012]|uniref:Holin of 3TMs, for gene-transfer release n=1 Tax=Bradyrhizobium aeschynomenes TaxID=2734909 RepID=A0ABX2CBE3_9BRAD|nr:hypothetical protein [Bradyrhizobium aeschynomenes]NPU64602.1 hypothetical protein [Bradyrhizobium aeschynomenes]